MVTTALGRELKRGSTELLILALLEERDRHGYELAQLIEQRSRTIWENFFAALNRVARPPSRVSPFAASSAAYATGWNERHGLEIVRAGRLRRCRCTRRAARLDPLQTLRR